MLVHRNMKKTKKKQKTRADKKCDDDYFQVGDPVYLKDSKRQNKQDKTWHPYSRISEHSADEEVITLAELHKRLRAKASINWL